jgi:hypothetical protein
MEEMPAQELTVIDKSSWPDGPWKHEPDKVQWTDEATGLPCLIVRHPRFGHLCGYVGMPEGHPLHGTPYEEVHIAQVHGGLTYSAHCVEEGSEPRICHTPAPGEPDNVWWLGFDASHCFDLSPGLRAMEHALGLEPRPGPRYLPGEVYRDVQYIREECTYLARQLATVTQPSETPCETELPAAPVPHPTATTGPHAT